MNPYILLPFFPFLIGIILIFGTIKRWKWLVEPPAGNWIIWLVYSISFIDKRSGKTFLIYCNYILGVFFILVSLFGIWYAIKTGNL